MTRGQSETEGQIRTDIAEDERNRNSEDTAKNTTPGANPKTGRS